MDKVFWYQKQHTGRILEDDKENLMRLQRSKRWHDGSPLKMYVIASRRLALPQKSPTFSILLHPTAVETVMRWSASVELRYLSLRNKTVRLPWQGQGSMLVGAWILHNKAMVQRSCFKIDLVRALHEHRKRFEGLIRVYFDLLSDARESQHCEVLRSVSKPSDRRGCLEFGAYYDRQRTEHCRPGSLYLP